jgi:hypothetical protein
MATFMCVFFRFGIFASLICQAIKLVEVNRQTDESTIGQITIEIGRKTFAGIKFME